MGMSPKTQIIFQKTLPYSLTWLAGAVIYVLLEKGILADSGFYPSTDLKYSFSSVIVIVIPCALIGGTLMGLLEVMLIKPVFQKFPFGSKIIIKATVYVSMMMLVLFSISFTNNSINQSKNFWEPEVINGVFIFFKSFAFWSVVIYGVYITIFIQFFTEVSDSLGPNQLKNFFAGTYHRPTEEERVFMFLDIKGSTTQAEKLGHTQYFKLLQQFFADISDPIVNSWGEIYQYVGDEVVVSWPRHLGLKNNNCIECFFKCKEIVKSNSQYYQQHFGLVPEFKAGIHLGGVAIGEIGVVKRDILFSGDVLNTTSRIQSKCNEFGVDLLISDDLFKALDTFNINVSVKEMGECQLRGKNDVVKLLHLSQV